MSTVEVPFLYAQGIIMVKIYHAQIVCISLYGIQLCSLFNVYEIYNKILGTILNCCATQGSKSEPSRTNALINLTQPLHSI